MLGIKMFQQFSECNVQDFFVFYRVPLILSFDKELTITCMLQNSRVRCVVVSFIKRISTHTKFFSHYAPHHHQKKKGMWKGSR